MMRKLAMAMVVSGALGSSFANALGLGEIKMNSGLNQPLDAEVKLLNVGDLSVSQILPNLGSHKDFSRAGVERVFFLTGIKFDVELDGKGGAVLHLTTDRIVREPYLNFLIELHWPSGRLLREYTTFLDPPLFSEVPPVAVIQAASAKPVATKSAPKAATAPAVTYNAPTYSTPTTTSAPVNASAQKDGTVSVKKNDTLWGIAKENRPDRSVTVRQTMLAIQQHNPDAFIRNNINLLKSGKVLRIPDVEEIRRVSSSQAYSETSRQNDEWASKKTIDATQKYDSTPADSSASNVEQSGLLKLVAEDADSAGGDTSDSASGGSGEAGANGTGGDSSEGGSGSSIANVDNLEKELQDLQRLMTLKQEQLALLQLSKAESEEKAEAELQSAISDAEALDNQQTQLVDGEAASEMEVGADTVQSEADAALETGVDDLAVSTVDGMAIGADAAQAEADAAKVAEIEAAAAQEARPEESVLDILTNNPLYIGVMIVVILGALILLGVISRRRNEEKEYPQELQEAIDASENDVELSDDFDDELIDVDEAAEETPVAEIADAEPLAGAAGAGSDDSRTLLDEADIYIAYGRYERAVEILQPAVNDAPENTALRLKLAEIFLASNELASFTQQEADLQAIGDGDALAKLDELKAKYTDVLAAEPEHQEVTANETSFAEEVAEPIRDTAEAEVSNEFDDLDFDFDLPDFDAPETVDTAIEETVQAADLGDNLVEFTTGAGEDIFDIDLDETSGSDNAETEDDNILEFSLDDDLELDESEEPQDSSDDADDMDFLVDTDESATKLELAKAYIDMADTEAAQEILNEVVSDGSEQQQNEAKKLLENLM